MRSSGFPHLLIDGGATGTTTRFSTTILSKRSRPMQSLSVENLGLLSRELLLGQDALLFELSQLLQLVEG
jgi:hypothetical protein